MSRTRARTPWSAAWSRTRPLSVVTPAASVCRVMSSNHATQRLPSRPWMRILPVGLLRLGRLRTGHVGVHGALLMLGACSSRVARTVESGLWPCEQSRSRGGERSSHHVVSTVVIPRVAMSQADAGASSAASGAP